MRRPPSIPPRARRPRPRELGEELQRVAPLGQVGTREESDSVSTRLRDRLEERRGFQRRIRNRKLAWVGAVILAIVGGVWAVAYSPLTGLDIDKVEVAGAGDYITQDDVHQILTPHQNTPLIRLDTGKVREGLRDTGAVEDATFVRVWPRGLRVELRVREPVVASPADEGFALLDGDGVEVANVNKAPKDLPVVKLGKDNDDVAGSVAAAVTAMEVLPKKVLKKVETVAAGGPNDVEFTLKDGSRVVWGSTEDAELKAAVLQTLLEVPAKVYNVAAPTSPITSS